MSEVAMSPRRLNELTKPDPVAVVTLVSKARRLQRLVVHGTVFKSLAEVEAMVTEGGVEVRTEHRWVQGAVVDDARALAGYDVFRTLDNHGGRAR